MAYEVSSSVDGVTFDFVQENGGNKRFDGNTNKNAPVTNSFDPPLKARYVALYPTECSNFGCAVRLDLRGTPGPGWPNQDYTSIMNGCKDNFERFYTNCYLHVTTPGNFSEQQAVCMGYGADLASIQTEEENDFIADITDNVRSWIGGKFDPNTDSFMWVDGSAMSLTKWRKREPNRWGGKEDCVETNFIRRGLWNDHFCVRQKAAVCKLTFP
ncbi:Lectin [Apostichopus japonicus]|uniref:Lectin n=1 Tax=Stichopus japonicus TaxID=307972 RepID=A0A2G8JLX6_STIJA|nr:Lectin [Apostichopus japonicus]